MFGLIAVAPFGILTLLLRRCESNEDGTSLRLAAGEVAVAHTPCARDVGVSLINRLPMGTIPTKVAAEDLTAIWSMTGLAVGVQPGDGCAPGATLKGLCCRAPAK
jgi:hypothetical protein